MVITITNDECIVLVGTHDLLATTLGTHDDNTSIFHDVIRNDKLPKLGKYLCVESLYHAADVAHLDTVLMLRANIASDELNGSRQTWQICSLFDFNTNQLRMMTNVSKHIALPKHADDFAVRIYHR